MDLFSGIGGFALGLKRAGGFRTVAYCEIDPYCQKVLQARMLDGSLDTAPICTDIARLDGVSWRGRVDLICGGFPCQDISHMGTSRKGLDGERSGLWWEMLRLIEEVAPRYVIIENVPKILWGDLERVLLSLDHVGYDAEWHRIPAAAVGAPHRRDRIWIVAYPQHPDPDRQRLHPKGSDQKRQGREVQSKDREVCLLRPMGQAVAHKERPGKRCTVFADSGWWRTEPSVGRLADGVSCRVDRIRATGNAVVPQVVEWIGLQIMKDESSGRK
jgi:DNA (cytosine-5)-methyltransferase 1